MCEMSVLEGLWGKNTDKEGVAGGRVNAQAFSFIWILGHLGENIIGQAINGYRRWVKVR